MFEWIPLTVKPKDGERLLLLRKFDDGGYNLELGYFNAKLDHYTTPTAIYEPDTKAVFGYMYADSIVESPRGYDPTFGDDRLCECGHEYYRHFDTYDNMYPVGCKYCMHGDKYNNTEGKAYPENYEELSDEAKMEYWSQCAGFKLAEGQ